MLDGLTFETQARSGDAALGLNPPTGTRRALSVLIPFFNEAGNIQPLIDEVHTALAGIDYEIVCINEDRKSVV
jgi:hypothetical protein